MTFYCGDISRDCWLPPGTQRNHSRERMRFWRIQLTAKPPASCLTSSLKMVLVGNLRATRLSAHLQCPIVLISGTVNENLQREAHELSGSACLGKPIKSVDILPLIA